MTRHWSRLVPAGAALILAAACSDVTSRSSDLSQAAVTAALSSVPIGYGDLASSYVGASADAIGQSSLWLGGGRDARFDRGGLMGGGIQDAFMGGVAFGGSPFGHRGPFGGAFGGGLGCNGTFDAVTGRIVCPEVTRHGLTVNRSAQLKDASGGVQQAFDTLTTNSVNVKSSVTGTVTFDRSADEGEDFDEHGPGGPHHGWGMGRGPGGRLLGDTSTILTATIDVTTSSDRTVSGLAQGSTSRKIDGVSQGVEKTTGTSSRGSFTATRTVNDATTGLVIPVKTGDTPPYPTAGKVVRSINATLKYDGEDAVSVSRSEEITYDGSTTAKVVITENGTTKNCTRPLPRGRLTCS